jgi:hypothetical protein
MCTAAPLLRIRFAAAVTVAAAVGMTTADAQDSSGELQLPTTHLRFGILSDIGESYRVTMCRFVAVQETQTYTVQIPITVTKPDGQTTTEFRTETRQRVVTKQKPVFETRQAVARDSKLYRMSGERIEFSAVPATLKARQPVIVLNAGEKLNQFYQSLFRPEVLVLVLPEQPAPAGPAAPR